MYSPQIDAAVVQSHKFGQKNVLGDLTWSDLGGIRWIYETQIEWEWFTRLVKTSEKGDAMGKLGGEYIGQGYDGHYFAFDVKPNTSKQELEAYVNTNLNKVYGGGYGSGGLYAIWTG